MTDRTPILLIGNGLNLSFAEDPVSVGKLIGEKSSIAIPPAEHIPFHLQVVLHTHDQVDSLMKEKSKILWGMVPIGSDQYRYYKKLLSLPVKDILTTNYDFQLEEVANDMDEITPGALDKGRDYIKARGRKRAERACSYTHIRKQRLLMKKGSGIYTVMQRIPAAWS